ncbi:MAG: glycosyltransferase [Anaerolineae bacterium]|nr:glycosyltransferase [Anaerolineae bacterium]
MTHIAYYISSHGFGHAARQQAVIRELAQQGAAVHVRTGAPQKFFKHAATYHQQRYDIGLIQPDALSFDIGASLQWLADFLQEKDSIIEQEIAFIREQQIQLIVVDMPQIAFDIAAIADVPSVLVSHFRWDWVYEYYMADFPQYRYLIDTIQDSYRKANLALRMPFAHDFNLIQKVEDIPLIYNAATQARAQLCAALNIPSDQHIGLLSMGGHDWSSNIAPLKSKDGWVFLVVPGVWEQVKDAPQRFRMIPTDYNDYHNLVALADVVIGKAGGSTVAEVVGHRTPMIYTLSPNWRESALLDEALQNYAQAIRVTVDDFRQGAWIDCLDSALQLPPPKQTLATNGVQVTAQRLLSIVRIG